MTLSLQNTGRRLNTARTIYRCPRCGGDCAVSVHEHAAVWECGFVYELPPIHRKTEHLRDCEVCGG